MVRTLQSHLFIILLTVFSFLSLPVFSQDKNFKKSVKNFNSVGKTLEPAKTCSSCTQPEKKSEKSCTANSILSNCTPDEQPSKLTVSNATKASEINSYKRFDETKSTPPDNSSVVEAVKDSLKQGATQKLVTKIFVDNREKIVSMIKAGLKENNELIQRVQGLKLAPVSDEQSSLCHSGTGAFYSKPNNIIYCPNKFDLNQNDWSIRISRAIGYSILTFGNRKLTHPFGSAFSCLKATTHSTTFAFLEQADSFADWIAAEVVGMQIKSTTPAAAKEVLGSIYKDAKCNQNSLNEALIVQKYLSSTEDRINQIYLSNPNIQKALGCTKTADQKYCGGTN